jgi:fatty-acyl-CoA synthase
MMLSLSPEWFFSAAAKRERHDELGFKVGHVTDEIPRVVSGAIIAA